MAISEAAVVKAVRYPRAGLQPQADGQVGLAHARGAEEEDVLRVGDEAPGRQLPNRLGVQRGLLLEVEVGHRGPHRGVTLLLGRRLPAQELLEEVAVAQLLLAGLLKKLRQLEEGLHQPQLLEKLLDPLELGRPAHPTTSARAS